MNILVVYTPRNAVVAAFIKEKLTSCLKPMCYYNYIPINNQFGLSKVVNDMALTKVNGGRSQADHGQVVQGIIWEQGRQRMHDHI